MIVICPVMVGGFQAFCVSHVVMQIPLEEERQGEETHGSRAGLEGDGKHLVLEEVESYFKSIFKVKI